MTGELRSIGDSASLRRQEAEAERWTDVRQGWATTEISHADSADREGDFFNEGDEVNKMRQMVMLRYLRNKWTLEGQGAFL